LGPGTSDAEIFVASGSDGLWAATSGAFGFLRYFDRNDFEKSRTTSGNAPLDD